MPGKTLRRLATTALSGGGGGGRHFEAAVLGAGPAGLATVARLLDVGVTAILWADPAFTAGRLSRYAEVPSNTKVTLFRRYAEASPTLASVSAAALEPLRPLDPGRGCWLGYAQSMVQQLSQDLAHKYADKVTLHKGVIRQVSMEKGDEWALDNEARSERVYLATGCDPITLPVKGGLQVLDMDDVLVPSRTVGRITDQDVVGVVGSSHSAVLLLRNLLEGDTRPSKVINFYRSPFKYAVEMPGDWILYDNTGLKGLAAEWARAKLETKAHEATGKLERVCVEGLSFPEQQDLWQKRCNKIVFAVGFEPTKTVTIKLHGKDVGLKYDQKSGKIADHLFGYGIAFPNRVKDPHGNEELAVGLWKFMAHLQKSLHK